MPSFPKAPDHIYSADTDRCTCGDEIVYYEDHNPPGYGCWAFGKPSKEIDDRENRRYRNV